MTSLQRLNKAIAEWDTTQESLQGFGAGDTEPDYVFQYCVWAYFNRRPVSIPTTVGQWQIFKMPGSGQAARSLTKCLKKVFKAIDTITGANVEAARKYLQSVCWRVS